MKIVSEKNISNLMFVISKIFLLQVLTHSHLHLSISIYVTIALIGGVCSLLLPIETKGKGLEEINADLSNLDQNKERTPCELSLIHI